MREERQAARERAQKLNSAREPCAAHWHPISCPEPRRALSLTQVPACPIDLARCGLRI